MYIDSHCHIHLQQFDADRSAVIDRASEKGVRWMVNLTIGPDDVGSAFRLAEENDGIFSTVGIHPHQVAQASEGAIRGMKPYLTKPTTVAVGEIGLDFYRDYCPAAAQETCLTAWMTIAKSENLPVIIHSRSAHERILDIISAPEFQGLAGIMHCFSGDMDYAKHVLDLGYYTGIGGNITFKNFKDEEVIRYIPLDRIVIETDAPYISPHPLRGQRNEPGHLIHTFQRLAEIKKMNPELLERQLFENTISVLPKLKYFIHNPVA